MCVFVLRCTGVANVATFLITIISAAGDALDGLVARWLRICSRGGGLGDKSTDKTLIGPLFCFMIYSYWMIAGSSYFSRAILTLLGINVLIDTTLFFSAMYLAKKGLRVKANEDGRKKMVFQCITGGFWTLFHDIGPSGFGIDTLLALILVLFFLVFATRFSILSAIGYYRSWKNGECDAQ